MSVDWESVFRRWAKPASDTEEERCDNATRMIRDAIHSEVAFANKQVDIFPQGSYHNNTNVRQNSDVDICICFLDTIYYELPTGSTPDKFGLGPATMNFTDYKAIVERALVAKFGRTQKTQGQGLCFLIENNIPVPDAMLQLAEDKAIAVEYFDSIQPIRGIYFIEDCSHPVIRLNNASHDTPLLRCILVKTRENTGTGTIFHD